MTRDDIKDFREALFRIAVVCGRQHLSDEIIEVYFKFLCDLPAAPLLQAMDRFARSAESGRRFPSPREIREWISSSTARPRGLSDDEKTRVWLRVNRAMGEWDATGTSGSAWPTFEVTWHAALSELGLLRAWRIQDRQDCWQRWLWHGATNADDAPIATREHVETILRDVMPRVRPGPFQQALREIADRSARRREPGEEG